MSVPVSQQVEPLKTPAAGAADSVAAVLSPALPVLPAVAAAASRFSALAFPGGEEAGRESESPDKTSSARDEAEKPPTKSTWQWLQDKAADFYHSSADHLSRLTKVTNVSELASWAADAVSDSWRGLQTTLSEAAKLVQEAIFGESSHDHAEEQRENIAESVELALEAGAEAFDERREQEKKNLDEFYEEIRHRLREPHGEGVGLHDASHIAVRFAAFSLDPKTIAELKLAILGNEIPPECMILVRKLLADINAEEKTKRSESGNA